MDTLQKKLASAIKLRESQNHEEARQLLLALHSKFSQDPQVNYGRKLPCAWIPDLLGLERAAVPFDEKAIQAGLNSDDLKSALLGMGSTYRCIGDGILLNSLADTSSDEGILRYQRAIRFYSDKLDQTW